MKPLIVPAFMLMLVLSSSCKKDSHDSQPEPTVEKKPSVEFISMKVDGDFYVDSLTSKSYFQKTNVDFSMLELKGTDPAVGKAGKDKKVKLYVRINFPGHEIKTGVYSTVQAGIDNAFDWQTFIDGSGLQDIYHASGNNNKHPDAPFRIEITRNDGVFLEGTFSGTAFGGDLNVSGQKEITEGKFKIAKVNMVFF
ncbi:hypothetical protein SAMN04488128_105453 [Chitinophaga eiseniae]|uniref:Uncharacterized protein n=1 Tax=Chitinophaga eiseniae TaxID=634771 RepID=A0A1T4TLY5_9BACT|nr:hypothetical protein [Chitinophaga eiseniae]SKA41486.1 hypothetical protein SAMN04488128_105453 [Chitinophaga eiseniae]